MWVLQYHYKEISRYKYTKVVSYVVVVNWEGEASGKTLIIVKRITRICNEVKNVFKKNSN